MEIQLTRTKTITIGGGPKKRKPLDIVGLDLFNGDARGCPAVRLVEKKGVLKLAAVGFVPAPSAPLPDSWETASKSVSWSLPAAFQAPAAALAATSPDMFLAQTTLDAVRTDVQNGAHADGEAAHARPAGERKFGIRRGGSAAGASAAAPSAAAPASAKPSAKIEIAPGVPVSNGGLRFVMQSLGAATGFVMEAGLPEYQALWLSRLLPEGRRPTAVSIQLAPSARTAAPILQPEFLKAEGTALALYASDAGFDIAGYRKGELVLWRNCRGVPGLSQLREKLKKGLGLDDEMVESVLNDNLIDPRPVMEPLIAPILDELAVSRDYLTGKLEAEPKAVLAFGLKTGLSQWLAIAKDRVHLELLTPGVFDGLERLDKIHLDAAVKDTPADSQDFVAALGAALAVYGEETAK